MPWPASSRCPCRLAAVAAAVLLLMLLIRPAGRSSLVNSGLLGARQQSAQPEPAQPVTRDRRPTPKQGKQGGKCPQVLMGIASTPHASTCPWWQAVHAEFVAAVKAADQEDSGYELILYGDSLTEMWHGSRGGKPYAPRASLPGIFELHLGAFWKAAAFGLSGDTSANLEWRLLNGELPAKRHPKVAVVLVGTNDLKDAKVARDAKAALRRSLTAQQAISDAAPAVGERVKAIVEIIRQRMPHTAVVLMALLPRHRANKKPPLEWPNMYTEGLQAVNRELEDFANQSGQRVTYLDCGAPFFAGAKQLNASLLPDALHPSPEGAKLLAQCIASGVGQAIQRSAVQA